MTVSDINQIRDHKHQMFSLIYESHLRQSKGTEWQGGCRGEEEKGKENKKILRGTFRDSEGCRGQRSSQSRELMGRINSHFIKIWGKAQ